MTRSNIAPLRATDTKNRELSWFSQMVERGREAPFTEIVTVTPAIAERLLERNESNRNTSEAQIAAICKDICSGFWQLNGETIIVSRDGFLNDGQNRLHAVVRAGEPIRTAMMFGVSRESRMSVDMGRQRRAADFMSMAGVKNSNNVAAIVTLFELYRAGNYGRSNGHNVNLTKQAVLAAYRARQKAFDRACDTAVEHKQIRSIGASSVGAAYMILRDANPVECEVFFARLADGAGLEKGSAILATRNRLLNRLDKLEAHQKLELILRGWNAWREGRAIEKCPPLRGSYPKVSR